MCARRRTAGPRRSRVPYAWFSRLLFVAAVATVAAAFFVPIGVSNTLHLLVPLLGAQSLCAVAARRSRLLTAGQVRHTDRRAPVLYLRSFATERAMFSQAVPAKRFPRWSSSVRMDEADALAVRRFASPCPI